MLKHVCIAFLILLVLPMAISARECFDGACERCQDERTVNRCKCGFERKHDSGNYL